MKEPIKRPPGPRGGELAMAMEFRRQPVSFFHKVVKEYGNIASFKLGPRWFYVVNEPEIVYDLLIESNAKFIKDRSQQLTNLLLGQGLITSEGDLHRSQRRLMQPHLHPRTVSQYAPSIVRYTAQLHADWRDAQVVDAHADLNRATLDIITETLFDTLMGEDGELIGRELGNMMRYVIRVVTSPVPLVTRFWPRPAAIRARRSRRQLNRSMDRLIVEGRTKHQQQPMQNLLGTLLDAEATQDRPGISTRQIRDEVVTLLLTGHETTANALAWTFHLLADHPRVREQLQAEVDAVLGPRETRPGERQAVVTLTAADVDQLPYSRQVLTEAMRLYPPAYTIGREATQDHQVGDYFLPKGTTVFMSQYVMHRDERFYPEPDQFDPSRWAGDAKERPRYSYFPFGGGPRGCIGEPFSWLEGVLMLSGLSYGWSLHHAPDRPQPEPEPLISLRPRDGVWMRLEAR